jgi:spore coat polysaccharide biosynthesis protein SpsF
MSDTPIAQTHSRAIAEHPRTLAIIQARMASTRLPGKVLREIAAQPMLVRVVERTRRARTVDGVVVATTTDPADDGIARLCASHEYDCYRGSMHDVLDRYYQAASAFTADIIVRITADCPLIDPDIIDHTVNMFLGKSAPLAASPSTNPMRSVTSPQFALDFAANRLPPPWKRTYPIGLDTEVCSFAALQLAWKEAHQPHQREHVMPYLYETSPIIDSRELPIEPVPLEAGQFRVMLVNHTPDYGNLRWTVDTSEDLELVNEIFDYFKGQDVFSWLDLLALFEAKPELAAINASVQHRSAFDIDKQKQNPQ